MAEEKKFNPIDNLQPIRTTEEAKARGKRGGIQSGISKRKKKLMSQIYADFLAQEHDIEIDGEIQKVDGSKYMSLIADAIIQKGGSPAVSLLKEIREATEGSKIKVDGEINIIYGDDQDSKL